MQVLTTGFWPTQVGAKCILPPQIVRCCDKFKDHYLQQHSGRRLTWQANMGSADSSAAVSVRVRVRANPSPSPSPKPNPNPKPGPDPNPNPNPNPNANPNQGVSNASLTALLEPLLGEEVRRLGLGHSW